MANCLCVECSVRLAETTYGSRHVELCEEHGVCKHDRANGFGQKKKSLQKQHGGVHCEDYLLENVFNFNYLARTQLPSRRCPQARNGEWD